MIKIEAKEIIKHFEDVISKEKCKLCNSQLIISEVHDCHFADDPEERFIYDLCTPCWEKATYDKPETGETNIIYEKYRHLLEK